jgi:hypothetical protein
MATVVTWETPQVQARGFSNLLDQRWIRPPVMSQDSGVGLGMLCIASAGGMSTIMDVNTDPTMLIMDDCPIGKDAPIPLALLKQTTKVTDTAFLQTRYKRFLDFDHVVPFNMKDKEPFAQSFQLIVGGILRQVGTIYTAHLFKEIKLMLSSKDEVKLMEYLVQKQRLLPVGR